MSHTVSLENGKYEFDIDDHGLMTAARRNGVDWPAGFELRHTKVFFAALNEVREEREAVVRWLRANENTYWANRNYGGAADHLERGEHRK